MTIYSAWVRLVEPTQSTQLLIEAAGAGNRAALGQLYEAHGEMVYRVAYRLTESWADAQDVMQQVFLGLPEAVRSYEGRGSFEGWLVQVTTRTALMRFRERRRRREVSITSNAGRTATAESEPEIEQLALDEALEALSPEQRAVFTLKVIEGYTHEEVGMILGISNVASRGRLHRALRTLRERLQ